MTLPWLADALRAAGLVVVEHGRWQSHARPGDWTPKYGVVHATAAPRSQADSVQIAVVRDGRSDLPGPIANAVIDRLGRWHLVSAGRCNSTLTGTAGPYRGMGNTYALSTEACNDNRDEPWPTVQYESYVLGWAAWCRRLGWTADRLVGHKEHTPGHKTDPSFNMAKFRADVAAVLTGKDADAMTPAQEKKLDELLSMMRRVGETVVDADEVPAARPPWANADYEKNPKWRLGYALQTAVETGRATAAQLAEMRALLAEMAGRRQDEIVAGVLAGLTPEVIAAAIPPALTARVADELARRLTAAGTAAQ